MKVIKFILLSVFILIVSFMTCYYISYLLYKYLGINIIILSPRWGHHFIAGSFVPLLLYFLSTYMVKISIFEAGIHYLIVCLFWESKQAIEFSRVIQLDQLSADISGIIFYLLVITAIQRVIRFVGLFFYGIKVS